MEKLASFGFNKFSQYGEDGIIRKIFELIGTTTKLCVEFGAWDGFHLSNTANLWTNSWRAVLIEGDEKRFRRLQQNVHGYDCVCVNAFVHGKGPQSLEGILSRMGVSEDIDLLSIDIDGDDYYIMEGLQALRPRVIVCEYNPTIPAELDLYSEYGCNFGCSVSALKRVGEDKGYKLVAITQTNCFFVLGQYADKFVGYETRLEQIKIVSDLTYLITSYSGEYVLSRRSSYGITYPFRRRLFGEHLYFRFPCWITRSVYSNITKMRTFAGLILRRSR